MFAKARVGLDGGVKYSVYLVLPRRTSATPYSSPKVTLMSRKASKARPSMRMFSRRALRTKARSLREGSASRGIMGCSADHGGSQVDVVPSPCLLWRKLFLNIGKA